MVGTIKLMLVVVYFYHPQQQLRKGNVFTTVCHSVQVGCTSPWADTPLWAEPPRQTHPTQADTTPLADTPPSLPRRLLQWMVRILLEYILVEVYFVIKYDGRDSCELWFLYVMASRRSNDFRFYFKSDISVSID